MTDIKLAPSILTADIGRLAEQVQAAAAGGADYIHLDIMDGRFVPVITFGPLLVAAVRKAVTIPLDIHMMVTQPEDQVDAFRDAGGDLLNIHYEATAHPHRVLGQIRKLGAKSGICINPGTPVSAIEDLLDEADQVVVMSVNPGWGGQGFIDASLDKINRLRGEIERRGLSIAIEVDGGVSVATAPRCVAAGADVLVCGSSVYNDRATPVENLTALRQSLVER